ALKDLSEAHRPEIVRAIMTTDTIPKETAVEVELGGAPVRIGAIAKGAGMISPTMATMFCFVTTDAAIEASALRKALRQAVDGSFNCITVDGDMSTSDTVLVLAGGRAGNQLIRSRSKAFDQFSEALTEVCLRMAKEIVRDAEGATRLITIQVTGAACRDEARQAGLAVANSPLVKTAFFGGDPNLGRIICAIGYSGIGVEESRISISCNGVLLFDEGRVVAVDEKSVRKKLSSRDILVEIDLGMGESGEVIYTSDLSYEYVKINAEYTT
ncbi:MAG: bifunctional glutamate N-acetyltransferase/amino-acid acetyltransferase ArgJ, partial [Candidatus Latescibacteria bacterium]|nr:bifunctional glutamate N-acetyltransferase/amino-acid acetyltransferase ArgJ [Candidatus Latescibacterota bacterium]